MSLASGCPWVVVLPAKPWALAKSRLDVAASLRMELARAMALDVLDTVDLTPSVARVVTVTAEPEMASVVRQRGGSVVADRPMVWGPGPNRAVRLAVRWAAQRFVGHGVAVVPTDLGALSPEALEQVLVEAASRPQGFVPDVRGTGTTVLTTLDAAGFEPCYGPSSSIVHSRHGMRALCAPEEARLDVDTLEDLRAAERLGLGLHVKRVLRGVVL